MKIHRFGREEKQRQRRAKRLRLKSLYHQIADVMRFMGEKTPKVVTR